MHDKDLSMLPSSAFVDTSHHLVICDDDGLLLELVEMGDQLLFENSVRGLIIYQLSEIFLGNGYPIAVGPDIRPLPKLKDQILDFLTKPSLLKPLTCML